MAGAEQQDQEAVEALARVILAASLAVPVVAIQVPVVVSVGTWPSIRSWIRFPFCATTSGRQASVVRPARLTKTHRRSAKYVRPR